MQSVKKSPHSRHPTPYVPFLPLLPLSKKGCSTPKDVASCLALANSMPKDNDRTCMRPSAVSVDPRLVSMSSATASNPKDCDCNSKVPPVISPVLTIPYPPIPIPPNDPSLAQHCPSVVPDSTAVHPSDPTLCVFETTSQKTLQTTRAHDIRPIRAGTGGTVSSSLSLKNCASTKRKSRLYNCNACDGSFTRAHDLKRHQRSHSSERAFVCETCASSFTRKDVLKRHIYRYGCNADRELDEVLRLQRRKEARTALRAAYEAELYGKTMTPEHIDAVIAASVAIAALSSIGEKPHSGPPFQTQD